MHLETRYLSLFGEGDAAELRIGEDQQQPRFIGLIPFGMLSVDLGGFRERLNPTAFRSSLANGGDIRALVDHDDTKLLGRTSNRTLRVAETDRRLAVEVDIPDTSYGRDVRELVRRRDIRGLSFGFRVRTGGQRFTKESGQTIRELLDIDLREVSVVGNPAYLDTDVALRSARIAPDVLKEISEPRNASQW